MTPQVVSEVGLAQRIGSVAPPGGVMLSESAARLAAGAVLGEPELLRVEGAERCLSVSCSA